MAWIDEEIAFYDFIWAYGVKSCTPCINQELIEDFRVGGNKFEEMKDKILKKFPTRESAMRAFERNRTDEP